MDEPEQPAKRGAVVKRRWAIIPQRGGRAVILATIGAIALGNTGAGTDPGQAAGQGDDQELVGDQGDSGSQTSPELP
jgi:hypothetical protein